MISSLLWSEANCHYFLKKTVLLMKKLLSANGGLRVFFLINLNQATRQNPTFIIYFHCIISFSLKMTAFSQESPSCFYSPLGNKINRRQKNVEVLWGLRKLLVSLFPLYTDTGTPSMQPWNCGLSESCGLVWNTGHKVSLKQ